MASIVVEYGRSENEPREKRREKTRSEIERMDAKSMV
jgi:hypothetical protein